MMLGWHILEIKINCIIMDSYKVKLGIPDGIEVYPIIIKRERICGCFDYLDRCTKLVDKLNNYMLRFINR